MKQDELSSLLDRARSGDQQAFTDLYENTKQTVYRTIHAMVRSEQQALDIQQDVYVQAFTHLDQLSDAEKLIPWLRTIAVNQTRTALRRQQPVLFSELSDESDGAVPEFPDQSVETSPELALDRKETETAVRELLGGLTDAQRMLVGMYYYEQIPVRQIAEDLGVSEGAVKSQLSRSRKKLEAAIGRLQKQGFRLFGLTPIPLLLGLLSRQELGAEAGKKVIAGALAKTAEAAQPVALRVGRSFFETALGKLALGVIAAGAIGGGALGYQWVSERLNAPIGDVEPTHTTQVIVMERFDSNEDLPTVPVTAEPETTQPDTTLPETSMPETGLDSSEDLPPEPTQPADPKPTDPQPTDPKPTDPKPTDSETKPADHEETEPQTDYQEPEPSTVQSWKWKGDSNNNSYNVDAVWNVDLEQYAYVGRCLAVSVIGNDKPQIVTDRPDLILLSDLAHFQGLAQGENSPDGITEYQWSIRPLGSGTAHISCVLNRTTVYSMTAVIPEPYDRYIKTRVIGKAVTGDTIHNISNCHVGALYDFDITVWGDSAPEISTDHPEIIRLDPMTSYTANWPDHGYYLNSRIIGAGDANVYIKLNGEIKETIHVHAAYLDSNGDQNPEEPSKVLSWNINGSTESYTLVKGLHGTVYIWIQGQSFPELSVDDTAVVSIDRQYTIRSNVAQNQVTYGFTILGLQEGTCTLYCKLNDQTAFSIPITVVSEL